MRRLLTLLFIFAVLAVTAVVPASPALAQEEVQPQDDVGEEDTELLLAACLADLEGYRDVFALYELWNYIPDIPEDVIAELNAYRLDQTIVPGELSAQYCTRHPCCYKRCVKVSCDLPHPPYCRCVKKECVSCMREGCPEGG